MARRVQRPPLSPKSNSHRQRKKPKKHPRKLQPKHPRQPRKRPPDRLPKPSAPLLQSTPRLLNMSRNLTRRGSTRTRCPGTRRFRRRVRSCSRVHRRRHRLRRQTSSNTQHASKSLRIHIRQCSPSPSTHPRAVSLHPTPHRHQPKPGNLPGIRIRSTRK
jgi:hypothetical protein